MQIESAQYIQNYLGQNDTIKATINGITLFIPIDTANTDYQAIQEWVAEGGVIEEADV